MTPVRQRTSRSVGQRVLVAALSCSVLSPFGCSSHNSPQPAPAERAGVAASPDAAAAEKTEPPVRADAGVRPPQPRADAGSAPKPGMRAEPPADAGAAPMPAADAAQPQKPRASAGPDAKDAAPCQQLRAAGDGPRTLSQGGVAREYLLSLPDSAAEPLPLVIDLHGLLTHAAFQRNSSGWAAVAQSAGFAVAYPQAIDAAWNLDGDGCCGADTQVDDIGFVRALVGELAASGCIDARRVYAVGTDAGGGLAQQLACKAAEVFAAVASTGFDLLQNASAACAPSRPISVLAVRDPADTALPYRGGELRPANGLPVRVRALGAEASLERWAELDGCSNTPEPVTDGCQSRGGCRADVAVALCEPASGSAAKQWEFLRRFQLP